ncbi:MAG: RNA-binding domain-containing protein [Candidatus Heimdallarchaeaceae archaeon]
MTIRISVRVLLYPTEDLEKVEQCIENIFNQRIILHSETKNDYIVLKAENIEISLLKKLFFNIRQNEILDTVRNCAVLEDEETLLLYLHKQALFVNKIAVVTEDTSSPFGNVELRIHGKNSEKLLDWLAPQTFEGKEVNPRKFNEIYSL